MKTSIWLLAIVCGASVALNLFAFSSPSKVDEHILVEIYEVPEYDDKGIHIHFGNNKTEIVPFLEFKKENHSKNGELILSTLNKLEREGYDLTHVTSGLADGGMITKVFMIKR
jgi:hypothetical protein